jgi:hypothetical protein
MTDIPEWAAKRAAELSNMDGSHYDPRHFLPKNDYSTSIGKAFARYIAENEEPPVDPVELALREEYPITFADGRAAAIRIRFALKKRGLHITEIAK